MIIASSPAPTWLALLAILIYCTLAVLVGEYAERKGHDAWLFTLVSILVSPLIGLMVALLVEDRRPNEAFESLLAEDTATELAKLGVLKSEGLLTEQEFVTAKSRVLGRDSG